MNDTPEEILDAALEQLRKGLHICRTADMSEAAYNFTDAEELLAKGIEKLKERNRNGQPPA